MAGNRQDISVFCKNEPVSIRPEVPEIKIENQGNKIPNSQGKMAFQMPFLTCTRQFVLWKI